MTYYSIKKRLHLAYSLLTLILTCSIIAGLVVPQKRAAAEMLSPVVNPIAPNVGSTVSGILTLSFSVQNLSPNDYQPYWSVDNGQWNPMLSSSQNNAIKTVTIDVSGWHWRSSSDYRLTFIALKTSDWKPVTQDVQIYVGNTPTSPTLVTALPTISSVTSQSPAATVVQPIKPKVVSLFADPTTDVVHQANAWITTHPADASIMNDIASQPLAAWFGDWNKNVQVDADDYVSRATSTGTLPVLVAYNIPQRDCGGFSAGGVANQAAYSVWINQLAAGIGQRKAMVIVEPDALAGMDCLSSSDQANRLNMLKTTLGTLKTQTSATVYLDAGNTTWHSVGEMTKRLQEAGIDQADGFSLNVSNFHTTADNISYGTKISKTTGNAHFVIDTSRNGNGPTPDNAWCNPAGRVVGTKPTLLTGNSLVDAYLWVKAPGVSDGSCGPLQSGTNAPPAGAWWSEYALNLYRG